MWGAGGIQVLWQGILTGCCVLGDPDRCRVFPAATRSWRKRHTAGELLTGACSPCPSNAAGIRSCWDRGCRSRGSLLTLCWGHAERLGGSRNSLVRAEPGLSEPAEPVLLCSIPSIPCWAEATQGHKCSSKEPGSGEMQVFQIRHE